LDFNLNALRNGEVKFVCHDINGLSCNTPEDDWTDYDYNITVTKKSANNKCKQKSPTQTKSSATPTRARPVEVYRGEPIDSLADINMKFFPDGWEKLIMKRTSGKLIGKLDPFWLTPKMKYRLRSMVEVKQFLIALDHCKGNEVAAKMNMKKIKVSKRKTEKVTKRNKKTKTVPSTNISTNGTTIEMMKKNDNTSITKKRKHWISPFLLSTTIESTEDVAVEKRRKTGITSTEPKLANDVDYYACNNNFYNNDCVVHDYMSLYGPITNQQQRHQQQQDDIPSSSVPIPSFSEEIINKNIDDDDIISHDYMSLYKQVILQHQEQQHGIQQQNDNNGCGIVSFPSDSKNTESKCFTLEIPADDDVANVSEEDCDSLQDDDEDYVREVTPPPSPKRYHQIRI